MYAAQKGYPDGFFTRKLAVQTPGSHKCQGPGIMFSEAGHQTHITGSWVHSQQNSSFCLVAGHCRGSLPRLHNKVLGFIRCPNMDQILVLGCRLLPWLPWKPSLAQQVPRHHTTQSPGLNNCLCVVKHGPDACAWLQVAAKQAALAALETQLGSTNSSASQNGDQILRLQLQMTELQDQHVAWQQSMLDGRLQELRAAAARVENNQALKARSQHLSTLP